MERKQQAEHRRKIYASGFWISKEPLFSPVLLHEAYEYFIEHTKSNGTAKDFFQYLYSLEADIPIDKQKVQP